MNEKATTKDTSGMMARVAGVKGYRKYYAYLIGEASWKIIILGTLGGIFYFNDGDLTLFWLGFLVMVVFTAGVAQLGYIGGQAWIDRYQKGVTSIVDAVTSGGGGGHSDSNQERDDDDADEEGD